MITIVFLVFLAIFAIAGVFLSLEAKKRRDGSMQRQLHPRNNTPAMGRATGRGDN